MADRGVDRSDDNPFSFKAFINDKENKTTTRDKDIFSDDDDEEDIFATKTTPAVATDTRKSQQSTRAGGDTSARSADSASASAVDNLDFDLDANLQEDKQKDNPFSFKKFLSSGTTSTNGSSKMKASHFPSYAPPPDIASDIPSFTNNYFEDLAPSASAAKPLHSSVDLSKTDSSKMKQQVSRSSRNQNNDGVQQNKTKDGILDGGGASSTLHLPLFHDDNDDDDDFESGETHLPKSNGKVSPVGLQLPDFLSDGPLLGGKPTMPIHPPDKEKTDEELSQNQMLQKENRRLQEEVSRMRQKCDDKNQRISQLKGDLEKQKKKEAEETAVMEKAVLQVEENLVTTTQRAVQAESALSKLKQEFKSLQNQMRCLSAENEAYRSGDGGMSDIRERTKYTSEQLKSGAEVAEKNLKDLLQGVEQMKLLSQVLATWEKVTEVKPEADESKS